MPTVLAFPGSFAQDQFTIPVGTQKVLGTVDVAAFSQIRVVVSEFPNSPSSVHILLVITSGPGGSAPGLLGTLAVSPGGNQTVVYDVPGTFLNVIAVALPGAAGQDTFELVIFGH
jgi:hypothetical protein